MQQLNLIFKFSSVRLLLFSALVLLMLNQTMYAQIPVLYGTSAAGGADSLGAIFKINADGSGFDTLYSFKDNTGAEPVFMHMTFYNGKLYGVTENGGQNSAGVIFSLDLSTHTYTDLLDFNHTNGEEPFGGLTLAGNKFYGMVSSGGSHGFGVLYSFDPVSNVYTDIFDFDSTNGSEPYSELTLAGNGKLYGGTVAGGQFDKGVIFSLTLPSTFQKIMDFDGVKGWEVPYSAALTDGGNGKLYGTTYEGGTNNQGVVYSINLANGTYQKVFDFDSTHGTNPATGLVLAANGKLYGTTVSGGANNTGIVFSVDPSNDALANVHDFNEINDGYANASTMIKGSDNILYGTAYQGGANGAGTIFSFDPATNTFTKVHDCTQIDFAPAGGLTEAITNTGIASVTNVMDITVSPNPVTDMAVLHFSSAAESEYRLTVTDVTGKVLMMKENVTSAGNQNLPVDLSNFSAGIYFLNMATGQQHQSLKLVKQ